MQHVASGQQQNQSGGGIKSPFGSGTGGSLSLMETVKEKLDHVRHVTGRKRSKDLPSSVSSTAASANNKQHDSTAMIQAAKEQQEQIAHQLAQYSLNDHHHERQNILVPDQVNYFKNAPLVVIQLLQF